MIVGLELPKSQALALGIDIYSQAVTVQLRRTHDVN